MHRVGTGVLPITALLACLLAATASAAQTGDERPAVVTVRGTKPLRAATMAEGARVSTNRDYTFTRVPEAFRGLAYTVNEHKNPATLTVAAETDGVLYACFGEGDPGVRDSQPTPAGLKMTGEWAEAGHMVSVAAGKGYRWTIYGIRVRAGQTLTVASGNRWGSAVLARKITGLRTVAARPGEGPPMPADLAAEHAAQREAWTRPELADEARRRWLELARQLGDRKWFKQVAGQAYHPAALIQEGDRDPADVLLRRTAALLARLGEMPVPPDLSKAAGELADLKRRASRTDPEQTIARYALFHEAMRLRRRIALSNPLLDFDRILFIQRHDAGGPFHMCDQYYGCNARPGGGLFVLEDPFGPQPRLRNLLEGARVASGRLKGERLEGGSFLSPELTFDARTIYFAWTQAQAKRTYQWTPECCYHVFRVAADGTGLRQLTDGPWDDFDPCALPSGRVAFVSLRRGGYLRCGRHCPTYALHA
ncbi:MAG: hypothetical protein U9R68_08870, partial [Planctomycetota bacterium]|nr:hypothetical protein [Planctomycetota bacterium]